MFGILPRLNQLQDHEITHSFYNCGISALEITIFELFLPSTKTSAIKAELAWPVSSNDEGARSISK